MFYGGFSCYLFDEMASRTPSPDSMQENPPENELGDSNRFATHTVMATSPIMISSPQTDRLKMLYKINFFFLINSIVV